MNLNKVNWYFKVNEYNEYSLIAFTFDKELDINCDLTDDIEGKRMRYFHLIWIS